MILKIGTVTGWYFVDKIENVQVNQTTHKDLKREEDKDNQVINATGYITMNDTRNPNDLLKLLRINLGLASFQRIIIDVNPAYLLNDEGKTIERIN